MKKSITQGNTVQFDNQQYIFEIKLVNDSTSLVIPPGIVDQLIITDSVFSIFPSGRLAINNSGNQIDNFIKDETNELRERITALGYSFNSDSQDRVEVYIKPVNPIGIENSDSAFPDDTWALIYDFSIYDEEEVVGGATSKQKVFYLRDVREQILAETHIQWSTADTVMKQFTNKIRASQAGNNMRKAFTGDAIKDILVASLPEHYAKFISNWDKGVTKLFYTSQAQTSSMDDLEVLLDHHISNTNNDNCILTAERSGEFSLLPLSFYFSNAYKKEEGRLGQLVIDLFNTTAGGTDRPGGEFVSPTYGFDSEELEKFAGLANFTYLNGANIDSINELSTTFVHAYDTGDKRFSIDCKDNHIMNVKKSAQKIYANNMSGKSPNVILPINSSKIVNAHSNHVFSRGNEKVDRLKAGPNKVLFKTLAYAPGISFDTSGASSRRSARFIIMSLTNADKDAPFTKFFSGEWFTTKVHHIFIPSKNTYLNTVTCVKPFAGDEYVDRQSTDLYQSVFDDIQDKSSKSTTPPPGKSKPQ